MTGGTGFVGSHAVAALIRHGHEVRVMARRPEAVARVLEPLGVSADAVPGDVTDPDAVVAALDGCEAVVHAAAHVGVSTGVGPSHDVNVDGTRNVLTQAARLDLDPVVYTSSVSIYLPSALAVITPDSPLAEPLSPYTASNARPRSSSVSSRRRVTRSPASPSAVSTGRTPRTSTAASPACSEPCGR